MMLQRSSLFNIKLLFLASEVFKDLDYKDREIAFNNTDCVNH